ncbi:restriction endonuclease subunit S [Calidifontibacter indicus]|uniref:restriction endonuclease subunit S n=1 Tax=Calidifontibacter indicus TaxID=419650 RepID=UPI003D70F853
MKTAPIGELTASVKTWNPSREPDNEFDYIDLSAVDNSSKTVIGATPTVGSEAPSRARQIVSAGDVLVSTVRPNLNAVAVVPHELDGATASTGFTVLRPTNELDGRFLFHWVRSPAFIGDMVRKATGASYPAVSDRIVKDSQIPAPPLPDQRRVAAILDHADALRAKRRQVLTHLDSLTKSIFNDMFGAACWDSTLVDIADVQIGPFGSLLHREDYVSDGVPVINPMHIRGGQLQPDGEFSVSENKAASLSTYRLCQGDVVLGRRGEMGRAGIAGPQHVGMLCGTGSLILRPRGVDSRFLHSVVTSSRMKGHLERSSLGATLPNLNATIVKASPAPQAPPDAQAEFAERLAAAEATVGSARRAANVDDHLFVSLQSRAFRGEL